jgi:hypothetical protein
MCNPASFVVTKDRVFWSKIHDQHRLIIEENKLHEFGVRGPNIVKIEITPPIDGSNPELFDNWVYTLDQTETPDWYDAKSTEALCRAEIPKWAKFHVVKSGRHIVDGNRSLVILSGSRVHVVLSGGMLLSYGSSAPKVDAMSGGKLWSYGSSAPKVDALSGGELRSYGSSAPKVDAMSGGMLWSCGSSAPKVDAMSGGELRSYGSSAPKVDAMSGGELRSYGSSAPKVLNDTRKQ